MVDTRNFENITASQELADITQVIIDLSNIPIRGRYGVEAPVVTATKISLNGDASTNNNAEPFEITNTPNNISFCRTQNLPYDIVISAILLAAKGIQPKARINSYGNISKEALELYRKAHKIIKTNSTIKTPCTVDGRARLDSDGWCSTHGWDCDDFKRYGKP